MDKASLFDALVAQLEARLQLTTAASRDAADYATNTEAKASSKWDTQGLEASYLAAGQAQQARELMAALTRLRGSREAFLRPALSCAVGAVCHCDFAGEKESYLLAIEGGGETVEHAGAVYTVLTPQSPLYVRLVQRRAGEQVVLPSGVSLKVLAVV